MKIYHCEQGTPDWRLCKLGIPSASNYSKIYTAGGKPSTQDVVYRRELIAEIVTGQSTFFEPTEWMLRGIELESEACAWYEASRLTTVDHVGFVVSEHGYGCSPDGLVDGGLLEIKAPKPSTHIGYVLDGKLPSTYKPQVQGQMLVCEREWCDFVSYLPGSDPFVIRVERDDKYTKGLHAALVEFVDKLHEELALYRQRMSA